MAVSLKHAFSSGKLDGADNSLVQPSNWNAEHTLTIGTGKILGRAASTDGAAQEVSVAGALTLTSPGGVPTLTGTGASTGKAIAVAIVFS
jgi:hypothetical protein